MLFALALTAVLGSTPQTDAHGVYAVVAIYDLRPDTNDLFEAALRETQADLGRDGSFLNERVLRNLDPLAAQYATYTKVRDSGAAGALFERRMQRLASYCRRAPEKHVLRLTHAYHLNGASSEPATGLEYGVGRVGQVAHLGLFVPYPKYRQQYDDTLHDVKQFIRDRTPAGYIGEDVLVEVAAPSPREQTPHSPDPREPSPMSVNYGEYDSLETAENAYTNRHNRPTDPKIVVMERLFFSALQVPTRFYLFEVIGNVGSRRSAAR